MDPTTIIVIVVVFVVVVFFLFSTYKIFGKKKSKEKKPKKEKASKAKDSDDDVKLEKKSKPPKINKAKLKQMSSQEAKVEPAFNKEDLEKERQEELQKQLEKNKASAKPQNPFMFPNMPYPFGTQTPRPIASQMTIPKPDGAASTGFVFPQTKQTVVPMPRTQILPQFLQNKTKVELPKNDDIGVEVVETLKSNGTLDKNLSFGESLMIKQAIDTPASKKEMNKKRNKWI